MHQTAIAARSTALTGLVTVLAVSMAGCAPGDSAVDAAAVTQSRDPGSFHSIELRGAATLDVLIGPAQSVVIEANPDTQARTTATVSDGLLVVDTPGGGWFWQSRPGKITVRITLPSLTSFALNGAGAVTLNGYAGGDTSIVMSGAGDLEASGTVDKLTARINGAGNADLSRLAATDAAVIVNGAGNLSANASGRLDATLNGVGSIDYLGTPRELNSSINGVGSIRRR